MIIKEISYKIYFKIYPLSILHPIFLGHDSLVSEHGSDLLGIKLFSKSCLRLSYLLI